MILTASTIVHNGTLILTLNGEVFLEGTDKKDKELSALDSCELFWEVIGNGSFAYTISISTTRGDYIYIKGDQTKSEKSTGNLRFIQGK